MTDRNNNVDNPNHQSNKAEPMGFVEGLIILFKIGFLLFVLLTLWKVLVA